MKRVLKLVETFQINKDNIVKQTEKFKESSDGNTETSALYVAIKAIHVGPTRNDVSYTGEGLIDALPTWVYPYAKPVLKDHCSYVDNTIGRVLKAEFVNSISPHTRLIAKITDKNAIESIRNGNYATVSIGSEAIEATCSICGVDIINEWGKCPHWRGEYYDDDGEPTTKAKGKKCVYEVRKLKHDEISMVATPADEKAGITHFSDTLDGLNQSNSNRSESMNEEVVKSVEATVFEETSAITEEVKTEDTAVITESVTKESLMKEQKDIETSDFTAVEKVRATAKLKMTAKECGITLDEPIVETKVDTIEETLNKKIDELNSALELKEMEIKEFEKVVSLDEVKIKELTSINASLLKETAELKVSAHRTLAERVTEIAYITNREFREDKELVINEYMEKEDNVLEHILNEYKNNIKSIVKSNVEVKDDTISIKSTMENDVVAQEDVDPACLVRPTIDMIRLASQGDETAKKNLEAWKSLKTK